MLHVIVIGSFFYLISARMLFVVESARHSFDQTSQVSDGNVADPLIRSLRREIVAVLVFLIGGALTIMFLNLGPVLLVAVALFAALAGFRRRSRADAL